MHLNTDDSAAHERPQCDATINKTNMKYGALMCVVNGQMRPNEGVWMQEAQWMLRLEANVH